VVILGESGGAAAPPRERPLFPDVIVVVHPVDVVAHPTYPPGFRWCVMVGGRPPTDLDYCTQAGHEPTIDVALAIGEMVGVAVVKGLRLMGCPAAYGKLILAEDPMPPESDDRPINRFGV